MPVVQVVLGSESDEDVVRESKMAGIMRDVGIEVRGDVYSAHRNLDELIEFVRESCGDVDVFIGVAGMAAALPGTVAAITRAAKPVIAVPLDRDGVDSCLHMPPGVPVALAGVGKPGLKNAALLAAQIVAGSDREVKSGLNVYVANNGKRPKNNVEL
jgi:5-(carboxyamino)imidazole ribonucleotide mutase